jgi:hypothetical protein
VYNTSKSREVSWFCFLLLYLVQLGGADSS